MTFWGRVGDAWSVLTGVVEVKTDEPIIVDGKSITMAELVEVDTSPKIYDISSISGCLNDWIEENAIPNGAEYEIKGDTVLIYGTLPIKRMV